MDDNVPKENPPADFNKLDLTQLQGFSFGTQWSQEKPSAQDQREGGERPRRDDRRDGPGGGAPDRRDRRAFRRPAGPGGEGGPSAPAGGPGQGQFAGDRRPHQGGGEYRGGPRREGQGGGGERGPRYGGGRGAPQDRGPYDSPYYSATFYPEDTSFNTLVQTIRKSCRTVELFEIARTVVAKTDRFVVVVAHKGRAETAGRGPVGDSAPRATAPANPAAVSEAPAKAPKPVFHISVPDGIPFETDDAAVSHVLSKHLDKFFDTAEVDVEPPKGNFQVINKCGITGELLGPPNYHRYNQIMQQHHAAKVSRMAFEAFKSRIETIRDPEVVNQWLAKMRKTTRYTWKESRPTDVAAKPAAPAPQPVATPAAPDTGDGTAPSVPVGGEGGAAAANAPAPEATAPATAPEAAAPTVPTFDSLEDARIYLLTQARDKVVRTAETARFHGKVAETMPPGEIRRAVEGALERQQRFPLDTANALRGRLRREHFTIFKKGSKGVSYVCAVKRKFRVPGQTFSDSIGAVISFIETNPMTRASELAGKFLGIAYVPVPKPAEPTAALPAEASSDGTAPAVPAPEAVPLPEVVPTPEAAPKSELNLSIDDRARLVRMQGDLVWLVREGYVTEFIDGRLFAPPPMVEARKKEIENEEHDPENFPEAPPAPVVEAGAAPVAASSDSEPSMPGPAAEPEATPVEGALASVDPVAGAADAPPPEVTPAPDEQPKSAPPPDGV